MARKRPVDSGRKDSLDRPIKVGVPLPARAGGSPVPSATSDFTDEVDAEATDELLDSILSGPTEPGTARPYAELSDGHEQAMADYAERIESATSGAEVLAVVEEMTSSGIYRDLPASFEELNRLHTSEKGKFYRRNAAMTATLEEGGEYEEDRAAEIRAHGLAALDAFEDRVATREMMEDYKNAIATGLRRYHEEFDTPLATYEADTLGPLTSGGHFETGSREWLEFRQNGIGGSDLGIIADTESRYHRAAMARLWDSKRLDITDEEVQRQALGQREVTDPISRGNALEEFIGSMYRRDHPEDTVMVGKSSWLSHTSPMQINFDALLSTDGVTPDGALEIKTSSRPQDWGDESEGLDGVPANYRAQVLGQVYEAGFRRGAVSVLINETDLRTYSFEMDDKLTAEAAGLIEEARQFKARTDAEDTNPYARSRDFTPKKGFEDEELVEGPERQAQLRKVATLRGTDEDSVRAEMQAGLDAGRPAAEVMRGLYEDSDLSGRRLIGMDLETTSFSPTTGRIIEIGMLSMDMTDGTTSGIHSELHDIPASSYRATGTGAVDVHKITAEDIAGKAQFSDPAVQRRVMDRLLAERDVVAHNVAFERQWLRVHLDGFAEAEARGDVRFIDTRDVTTYATDTRANTLEAFCEDNGVSYTGAHRAYQDTEMMMKALHNWSRR